MQVTPFSSLVFIPNWSLITTELSSWRKPGTAMSNAGCLHFEYLSMPVAWKSSNDVCLFVWFLFLPTATPFLMVCRFGVMHGRWNGEQMQLLLQLRFDLGKMESHGSRISRQKKACPLSSYLQRGPFFCWYNCSEWSFSQLGLEWSIWEIFPTFEEASQKLRFHIKWAI